jgi:hypothetical protein
MSSFAPFAQAVHARLNTLSTQELFTTVTGDGLSVRGGVEGQACCTGVGK